MAGLAVGSEVVKGLLYPTSRISSNKFMINDSVASILLAGVDGHVPHSEQRSVRRSSWKEMWVELTCTASCE